MDFCKTQGKTVDSRRFKGVTGCLLTSFTFFACYYSLKQAEGPQSVFHLDIESARGPKSTIIFHAKDFEKKGGVKRRELG